MRNVRLTRDVTTALAVSFADRVTAAIDELRVAMEPDGGGVEIVRVTADAVTLQLVGSCLFCPSRALSAGALERGLRERVPDLARVDILYPTPEAARVIDRVR